MHEASGASPASPAGPARRVPTPLAHAPFGWCAQSPRDVAGAQLCGRLGRAGDDSGPAFQAWTPSDRAAGPRACRRLRRMAAVRCPIRLPPARPCGLLRRGGHLGWQHGRSALRAVRVADRVRVAAVVAGCPVLLRLGGPGRTGHGHGVDLGAPRGPSVARQDVPAVAGRADRELLRELAGRLLRQRSVQLLDCPHAAAPPAGRREGRPRVSVGSRPDPFQRPDALPVAVLPAHDRGGEPGCVSAGVGRSPLGGSRACKAATRHGDLLGLGAVRHSRAVDRHGIQRGFSAAVSVPRLSATALCDVNLYLDDHHRAAWVPRIRRNGPAPKARHFDDNP